MDMCIHTVRPTEWAVEDFAAQIAARSAAALVATKCGDDRAAVEAAVAAQVVAHVHWILVQTPDQRRRGCRNGVAPAQQWCGETVHGVHLAAPEHWTNLRLIPKEVSRRNIGRSTATNPNDQAVTDIGCSKNSTSNGVLESNGIRALANQRDTSRTQRKWPDWNLILRTTRNLTAAVCILFLHDSRRIIRLMTFWGTQVMELSQS
jgi:hypothetical protein